VDARKGQQSTQVVLASLSSQCWDSPLPVVCSCGQVKQVESDSIFVQPDKAHATIRADWLKKTSTRITRAHMHPDTHSKMRAAAATAAAPAEGVPAAAAGGAPRVAHVHPPAAGSSLHPPAAGAGKNGAASPNPGASPIASPLPSVSPAPQPISSPAPGAAPVISPEELKKFRSDLKVGDLVDFQSNRWQTSKGTPLWFLGEVARMETKFLVKDEVSVYNHTKNDTETMSQQSGRLWPPMTQTEAQQQAHQAAAQAHAQAQQHAQQQAQAQAQAQALAQQQQPAMPPRPAAAAGQQAPLQGRPGNMAGNVAIAGASAPPAAVVPAGGEPSAQAAAAVGEGAVVPPGGPSVAGAPVSSAASVVSAGGGSKPRPPPLVQHAGVGLRPGDLCDCLDTEQKWRLAEVIRFDGSHQHIHYVDWNAKVGRCTALAT
jgi:hypothetical protein